MKQLFRAVTLLLIVGGWGLAGAAVHVVRTPGHLVIVTKDQLGYAETYVDTRKWVLADDRAHPVVVSRMLHTGRSDALAHTIVAGAGPVQAQLAAAIAGAPVPPGVTPATLAEKAQVELSGAVDAVKTKLR